MELLDGRFVLYLNVSQVNFYIIKKNLRIQTFEVPYHMEPYFKLSASFSSIFTEKINVNLNRRSRVY